MGQEITLLFTKDNIKKGNIPKDQIFFRDKGYFIFPLDIDDMEMEVITKTFKKFQTFEEIKECSFAFSDNANKIIHLLSRLKIETFLLEHYSEWADIPYAFHILIVKENKVYTPNDSDSIEDILGYFKFTEDRSDVVDIDKYRNYGACEKLFKQNKT